MMNKQLLVATILTGSIAAATPALADHNSIWGPGTANMPNDIHNTRIEDDNETFLELVQQGGGADSVNRYDDGTDTTTRSAPSRMVDRSTMGGGAYSATGRGGRP
jgi:hypothetical protein